VLPFRGEGAAVLPFRGEGAAVLPFRGEGAAALSFRVGGAAALTLEVNRTSRVFPHPHDPDFPILTCGGPIGVARPEEKWRAAMRKEVVGPTTKLATSVVSRNWNRS
jgi:hypothetical protein